MIIGVPKEIKDNEYRVALAPAGARALSEAGHKALVEKGAGEGSGITDDDYSSAGAEVLSRDEVWKKADLIIKVKEPLPDEYFYFRDGQVIFAFFHLASDQRLAAELIKSRATALAYETVETDDGRLPILAPMSEVAGRLSAQIGAHYLLKQNKGMGILLGGVTGVAPASVVVLGAGTVGLNAGKAALGLGARVTIIDADANKLKLAENTLGHQSRIETLFSNSHNIEAAVSSCELLIGAAHSPGAKTPKLVSAELVAKMKKGSVIVDVSVDQGGCVETIRPTTHSNPVYEVSGVLHYGVSNMPGAVPRTSTFALTNATLPYLQKIANLGFKEAVNRDSSLKRGINIHAGMAPHKSVAAAIGKEWRPIAIL